MSPQRVFLGGDVDLSAAEVLVQVGEGVILVGVAVGPGQQHVALAQTAGTLPLNRRVMVSFK